MKTPQITLEWNLFFWEFDLFDKFDKLKVTSIISNIIIIDVLKEIFLYKTKRCQHLQYNKIYIW